ncbi:MULTISPECIES: DUF309 domain-containing protein [unclassified Bacillus (in: firmicutes)]|uniref:DUF309 domain-containing protein n=1 Tax=unclassified Bacillus (in: firmicutes) TaxID=185979 RepID=UPI0008E12DFC|nr:MULTISPECIES: DUF309 domain-containing protein [unclassified Bacillus (in: firmicutes)]SFA97892.1 hypothetical protein SAMN02799634_103296 [Bacillus sp. UNCCL13]SFQ80706.1 hypothetical protein SAMN04488577_1926 [Bacillus sp. cl95]
MYPKAYVDYLVHFHGDRDYFECHEILEEYWKETDNGNKASIWVGLILLAVSTYHHRRNNFSGALRTIGKAKGIFTDKENNLRDLGIDPKLFMGLINELIKKIEDHKDYQSVILPLSDRELIELCKKTCIEKGTHWLKDSDINNYELLHRHMTRDRTDVILERENAIRSKTKGSE